MLTRLWNRDCPDRYAAALIARKNNAIIDAAKTGYVVDWKDNIELTKRINRATGGKNGRMPYFFQFSKNGRRDLTTNKKKRKWARPNNSTMNRICAAFDDIGNINMNYAGIPPFNWQMLMQNPCLDSRMDIVETFYVLDNTKTPNVITEVEESPTEKEIQNKLGILAEYVADNLIQKYGSLEYCYPYITKDLFTGENAGKYAHKQTYWKIFGDIAVRNLRSNLNNCYTCFSCGAKVPNWVDRHVCIKGGHGFFVCTDCNKLCERQNSRQSRCPNCQKIHRLEEQYRSRRERNEKRKNEACYTSWPFHFKRT